MKKLYPEERLMRIMEILNESKKVEVEELIDAFNVTGATIRSDLRELERRKLVHRTHGGALLKEGMLDQLQNRDEPVYGERVFQNHESKMAIGRAAAKLIHEGDSVIIDDGSTTLEVARALPDDLRITLLTNGIDICRTLAKFHYATVYSTGGKLNKDDLSHFGQVAVDVTSRFNATKAILGASGISIERGLTTPSEEKGELKKVMIDSSDDVILVADHTKLNRSLFIEIAPLESISTIITDKYADEKFLSLLMQYGIEIIIADPEED